jgi:hypothetical protein
MNSSIILLVTDDPDDQQIFAEAFTEISSHFILVSVRHPEEARKLLQSKKIFPDIIFINLSDHQAKATDLVVWIRGDGGLGEVKLLLYGEESDYPVAEKFHPAPFLMTDSGYSAIVEFVKLSTLGFD